MEALSDDDFERVSDVEDIDISESESDHGTSDGESQSSTPPSHLCLPRPSDRKNIPCPYQDCQKTFNRRARLKDHLRSHTNSRIFKCKHEGCDKDFLRETHLRHHVKSAHSNIRDYKCTWEGCDKSFATGTRLRRHFQAHEGREKYRCRGYENCDQTFRKHETLKRHILQVHEHMRPFPCNDTDLKTGQPCDKAFDTAEKLRVHQRTNHDSTRFSCTECLNNQNSNTHAQQPIAFFATYSDLQAHVAEVHPPMCPYCPTSFTTSKELTRHLEIQHNIMNSSAKKTEAFSCTFPGCDRSFSKKGNLNVHIKTVHEKKKDFVCGETEIAIPEELRSNGPVEIYGCGRAFTAKAVLEDHVRSAHLGMTSLQVERKKKRKAENRENGDAMDVEPKTRKPRKDKGVKKTSFLKSLTGAAFSSQKPSYLPLDPALANLSSEPQLTPGQIPTYQEHDIKAESDDEADFNQLSGSMTLLDDRLYHYDDQYEYITNDDLNDPTSPLGASHQSDHLSSSATYSRVNGHVASDLDDEPFFDGFEHEPESMPAKLTAFIPVYGTN